MASRPDSVEPSIAAPLNRRDAVLLLVQLALLTVLVWQTELERVHHLLKALMIATGGFAVHLCLPPRLRKGWFLAVSVATIGYMLGPVQAGAVLLLGGLLLAVASLPVPFLWRAASTCLVAGVFFFWRGRSIEPFWAVLGSMFMFRLIVYLYSIHKERIQAGWTQTLSYFFLLPNPFFPLFPVVDFKTFCRSHDAGDRRETYQRGVHWIAIGVLHLLLYRYIKYELLPMPLEIRTVRGAAAYFALTYGLYVRTSGQFHIICGILHLFGFNLPRTHDCYFLASSYSDIWRRINIYWKDFLKKVCFYPAFFRLRSLGQPQAVFLAVLWVFFWTWLGHSWQTFWIIGKFPLTWSNFLMWMGVGIVVAVNSLFDFRNAGARTEDEDLFRWSAALIHSLKVIAIFSTVSIFWAYWTRADIAQGLLFSGIPVTFSITDLAWIGGTVAVACMIGVLAQWAKHLVMLSPNPSRFLASVFTGQKLEFETSVLVHLIPLAFAVLLAQPSTQRLLGEDVAARLQEFQKERYTRGDVLDIVDGYYEQLNASSLQAGPFVKDPRQLAQGTASSFSQMTRPRRDILEMELIPGWSGDLGGGTINVNRWTMRDRPRELLNPERAYRIALVGSSVVMGYGVNDDKTFAHLLEQRLNADAGGKQTFEVLNFGVGRYYPIHRRAQIERKVLAFRPDLIVYFAHQDELYFTPDWLQKAIKNRVDLEDPCLDDLVHRLRLDFNSSLSEMRLALSPRLEEILRCTYARIQKACEQAGARLLYVYSPMPHSGVIPIDSHMQAMMNDETNRLPIRIAESLGIQTIVLDDWWKGHAVNEVTVDVYHPNNAGHELIAEQLIRLLESRPELLQPTR